ncbi:hypothetical protein B0J12DRAFT_706090 [Macrophomina phaseolina]|uniref:Uncharacterized protein n=1 Tax=Macrophomina phaseolina TaxID=35725 RepID=A0ABQ8FQL1_9PEZI|nr:hypothetical protein B0J12DRAFT_706090 [Macrophomina phaseolina]
MSSPVSPRVLHLENGGTDVHKNENHDSFWLSDGTSTPTDSSVSGLPLAEVDLGASTPTVWPQTKHLAHTIRVVASSSKDTGPSQISTATHKNFSVRKIRGRNDVLDRHSGFSAEAPERNLEASKRYESPTSERQNTLLHHSVFRYPEVVCGMEFGIVDGTFRFRRKMTYRPANVEQDGLVEVLRSDAKHLIRRISYLGKELSNDLLRWILEDRAILFGEIKVEWGSYWSEWLQHAEDDDFAAFLDYYKELSLGGQLEDDEATEIEDN